MFPTIDSQAEIVQDHPVASCHMDMVKFNDRIHALPLSGVHLLLRLFHVIPSGNYPCLTLEPHHADAASPELEILATHRR